MTICPLHIPNNYTWLCHTQVLSLKKCGDRKGVFTKKGEKELGVLKGKQEKEFYLT